DLILLDRQGVAKHGGLAVGLHQLDAQVILSRHDDGLLIVAEVVGFHGRDIGLGLGGPLTHGVRVGAHVVLHGLRRTAVGVALTQHRVHGGAHHGAVAGVGVLLLLGAA